MSILNLNPGEYGTLRQEASRASTIIYDMRNEIGGLWTMSFALWTASAGVLDFGSVEVLVRATDPTGVDWETSIFTNGLGVGVRTLQQTVPILYKEQGTFEVEFRYLDGFGAPAFGHQFTMVHPFGSY